MELFCIEIVLKNPSRSFEVKVGKKLLKLRPIFLGGI